MRYAGTGLKRTGSTGSKQRWGWRQLSEPKWVGGRVMVELQALPGGGQAG